MDLVIILVLTLITIPVVEFTHGIPRIIMGIILLLVSPGYSLISALFPSRKSLRGIERAGLTLVLSFAIVSLSGLLLNYTPWGIRLTPILIAVAIIIIFDCGIALFRRRSLPETERFILQINLRMPQWNTINSLDKVLYIGLIVVVIGAISTLSYVIAKPKAGEAFTNFYILGPEGKIENYPSELKLGEQAQVKLGIDNHENKEASYIVKVILQGKEAKEIGPIVLADDKTWLDEVTLVPS